MRKLMGEILAVKGGDGCTPQAAEFTRLPGPAPTPDAPRQGCGGARFPLQWASPFAPPAPTMKIQTDTDPNRYDTVMGKFRQALAG